ncbi:hypothetical protein ACTUVK_003549 [Stenotrophomonas rhizophila]|uniref:Uncharacterized protein n=1 Tax=Stenotrophomonas nematodicola TaxID=2656746 RepID=A0ABW7D1S1_9GAMM
MTPVKANYSVSVNPSVTDRSARIRALGRLLRHAASGDADVLLAGLARMLDAHIGNERADGASNGRIRDQLDEIELLLALEIERAGVRAAAPLSKAA